MTAIRLRSEADFGALLASVIEDVQQASFHWRLHLRLRGSIRRYVRELNESRAFWSLTIGAHRDAALFRLARLYEPHAGSLSLARLLDTIADNLKLFDEAPFRARLKGNPFVDSLAKDARRPPVARLARDIRLVRPNDRLVSSLVDLRNQVLAHRDPRVVVGRARNPLVALSDHQFEVLLTRASRIVNRYSILFVAGSHLMRIMGDDDYLKVLKALREHRLSRERDFREELKRAGLSAGSRRTRGIWTPPSRGK